MKRGNKKGQFYLISAVVLAMLVVGLFTISNYSERESDIELDYLKEEIHTESAYVMDYGLYNGLSNLDFYKLLSNFTKEYIDYSKKNMDLYFVFGDSDNLSVTGYQETEKQVSISSGSSYLMITNNKGEFAGGIDPATDILTLSINDIPYEFELYEGQNFYFVLSKKINKAEYIVTG